MHVPQRVRKNVVFIGVEEHGRFIPKATAFIVSCDLGGKRFDHFVTAEHVIVGLQTKGYERPLIRLNLSNGGGAVALPTIYDAWFFHPDPGSTDIAVSPANIDRSIYEFTHTPLTTFAMPQVIDEQRIGVGDEIFICGLFKNHWGQQRNIPVVRTGNIAAMPEEPIRTEYCGDIDAYLVEARSIGGLSGSPVFVHLPPIRVVDNDIISMPEGGLVYYLIGLMHGHFDVQDLNEDVVTEDGGKGGNINTGIGVVIPAQKISETIMQPELAAKRQAIIDELKSKGATADLVAVEDQEPPTKAENPQHREDFNRLLDAAVPGNKSDR